jgi:hypothetical protein
VKVAFYTAGQQCIEIFVANMGEDDVFPFGWAVEPP